MCGLLLGVGLLVAPADPRLAIAAATTAGLVAVAFLEPRWALLALLAALILFLGQPTTSGTGVPGPAPDLLLLLVAVGVLVRYWLKFESVRLPAALLSLFIFVAVLALAAVTAQDPTVGLNRLLLIGRVVVAAGLILVLIDDVVWFRRAIRVVAASIAVLAGLTVLQQWVLPGVTFGGLATDSPGLGRRGGPMGSANFFAQALLVGAVLAGYLGAVHRRLARLAWFLAAGLCGAAIVLTGSRGGLVALGFVCLLVVFLHPARAWVLIVVLAIASAIVLPRLATMHRERVDMAVSALVEGPTSPAANRYGSSIRSRFVYQLVAWEMFKAEPVLGVGPDHFPLLFAETASKSGIHVAESGRSPHNVFAEALAETGFLGFCAFGQLLLFSIGGANAARRRLPRRDALLAEGLMVGILAFLAAGVFLHFSTNAGYLFIPIGLALAARRLAYRGS